MTEDLSRELEVLTSTVDRAIGFGRYVESGQSGFTDAEIDDEWDRRRLKVAEALCDLVRKLDRYELLPDSKSETPRPGCGSWTE